MVYTTEQRIRQTMRCMGLRYDALIASWVLTAVIQFTLTALLVTAVMTSSFLPKSNKILVFCYVEV